MRSLEQSLIISGFTIFCLASLATYLCALGELKLVNKGDVAN